MLNKIVGYIFGTIVVFALFGGLFAGVLILSALALNGDILQCVGVVCILLVVVWLINRKSEREDK